MTLARDVTTEDNTCQTCRRWLPNWRAAGEPGDVRGICNLSDAQTDPDLLGYCPSHEPQP